MTFYAELALNQASFPKSLTLKLTTNTRNLLKITKNPSKPHIIQFVGPNSLNITFFHQTLIFFTNNQGLLILSCPNLTQPQNHFQKALLCLKKLISSFSYASLKFSMHFLHKSLSFPMFSPLHQLGFHTQTSKWSLQTSPNLLTHKIILSHTSFSGFQPIHNPFLEYSNSSLIQKAQKLCFSPGQHYQTSQISLSPQEVYS